MAERDLSRIAAGDVPRARGAPQTRISTSVSSKNASSTTSGARPAAAKNASAAA
jgi:hypothetical protein